MDCKLQIIYPDEDEGTSPHPHCPHGPTLLFKMPTEEDATAATDAYYACAAHRDKRSCNFHMAVEDVTPKKLAKRYDLKNFTAECKQQRHIITAYEGAELRYCHDCNLPLCPDEHSNHNKHEVATIVSADFISDPTRFLHPLEDDKVQAQYFFDNKALVFFTNCFLDLGINKVICMGAPRLHAHLRNSYCGVKSFLLDFDYRMYYFYGDDSFAWYNMCNNHFFDDAQRQEFEEFLKCTPNDNLMIFTDPPFGCRTEPIAGTLRQITRLYNMINQLPHQPLPIFWIFPYFSEHYIQQEMPHMRMCDYKVNYTNHTTYTDVGDKSRKLGSPVRVFTNVPLELLKLPVEEEYKYCAACQRYTALENRHCSKCDMCPSKNGSTYQHCDLCGCCVKPNYVHCKMCRRCTQAEEHECQMYQANQHCWICLQKGHTEFDCIEWRKHCKHTPFVGRSEKVIICLLCRRRGHNERDCMQRSKYLNEFKFLGVTEVKFRE